jgi:hypothetical protein
VQKTEGEGGTAYSAKYGVQKTEGEGGTAYSAKYGVQKTEGEETDYYATHGIKKSAGRSMTQAYQAGASRQQTIAPEAHD